LLLQQHFQRIQLQYYGPQADVYEFLEGIVGYIGQIQNAGLTAAQYSDFVVDLQANPGEMHAGDVEEQADLARLYTLYEEVKAEVGAYDYNDQLALPLEILRQRPNLAERLAREYATFWWMNIRIRMRCRTSCLGHLWAVVAISSRWEMTTKQYMDFGGGDQ